MTREKKKAYDHARRLLLGDAIRERNRAWKKAHPEQTKAARSAYYRKNKEKILAKDRAYYLANKKGLIQAAKARYLKDPENYKKKNRAYCAANPERVRKWHLKKAYGLTLTDFQALLDGQRGLCACCGKARRLEVDHCHKSGKVRGLLCHLCNVAAGAVQDHWYVAAALARYLRKKPVKQLPLFEVPRG